MRIVVVGVSHSSAPLSVLERVSVPPGELDVALARLKHVVDEGFVLSTCNRTEIYAVLEDGACDAGVLLDILAERGGEGGDDPRSFSYALANDAAVKHALRVASGLDSMVLGEDQIQAQMKRALGAARGAEMLGATLERLGAAALGCGKRVRTFTGLGHHAVSLESVAVDAAVGRVGPLAGLPVVVLGSGSSAAVVARQLKHRGARDITIVGRSQGRAHSLAMELETRSAPWEQLAAALADARVVFCCTSAPHPVLTPATLARRLAESQSPLLCVDLGMPRDVDAAVTDIGSVSVVSLEELGNVARSRQTARRRHLPAAETIVERETERFLDWVNTRGAVGAITQLRAQADAVADAEAQRALARLQHLDPRAKAIVADMARRIVRKLMHQQTHAMKLHVDTETMTESEEAVS